MPLPIRPTALMEELRSVLSDIEAQMDHVKEDFLNDRNRGLYFEETTIWQIKDRNGMPILQPLLVAKAQCLTALVQLSQQPAKR